MVKPLDVKKTLRNLVKAKAKAGTISNHTLSNIKIPASRPKSAPSGVKG